MEESLLKAPRNLNEPVRCSISGLRNTFAPTRASSTGNDSNGVRTANGATTLAAESISAGCTGKAWEMSVMNRFYRVQQAMGKMDSGDAARRLGHEIDAVARCSRGKKRHMRHERPRGSLPAMLAGERDTGLSRNRERLVAGFAQ